MAAIQLSPYIRRTNRHWQSNKHFIVAANDRICERRVPNFMTIFITVYKGKGLCVYMWKGIKNKGRRLRQVYKGNVETISELIYLKNWSESLPIKCTKNRADVSASLTGNLFVKKASFDEEKFNPVLVNIKKLKGNFRESRPENANSYSYNPFQLNRQLKLKTHVKILFSQNIYQLI